MKLHLLSVFTACLLALPAMAAPPAGAGVPERPSRLGLCAACHGERGIAVAPGVPNLAGQRLDYLLDAIEQYRDGRRKVPAMRAALGPLSREQVEQVARWYAAQPACRRRADGGTAP